MAVRDVKELTVYIKAYRLAMEIFEISKRFPADERYALTSQVRRSSRSVCHNLREAWAKRRYEAHFVSKLSDCIGENWETDTAIDFAHDCSYINKEAHAQLTSLNSEVGKMLRCVHDDPEKFLTPSSSTKRTTK
jgi:four helix bundle protein